MNRIESVFETFPIIESERLSFREFRAKDVDFIFELHRKEEMMMYQGQQAFKSRDQAVKKLEFIQQGYAKKYVLWWALEKKSTKELIGHFALHHFDLRNHKIEVGISIYNQFKKLGYGYEALERGCHFLFRFDNLNRIEASIHSKNQASISLFKKMGFICEGLREEFVYNADESKYEDRYLYRLLKKDD